MRRGARILVFLVLAAVLLSVGILAILSALAARPGNLGIHAGRLADCPRTPNCVGSSAGDAAHRIEPLHFTGCADAAFARLRRFVAESPGAAIITADDRYLHAEFTSRLFRFVDDVEFLVDADAGVIHVRSASRVGKSDLGVNRARVEALRERFAAK